MQNWFEGLWNWVSDSVNAAASWILDNLWKPIVNAWNQLKSAARALAPEGYELISQLVSHIPWPWSTFFEAIFYPVALLYGLLKPAFSWLWDKISPYLGPVKDILVGFGDWAWKSLQNFVKDPVGTLSAGWNWIASKTQELLNGALNTINSGISWLWDRIGPYVKPVWDIFVGVGAWFKDAFTNFFRDPVGTLSAGWNWVTNSVRTMFDGAVGTIGSWVSNALAGVAGALGEGLKSAWNWFIGGLGGVFSSIGTWLNDHIVKPVWEGFQWLWNWITGAVRGVFDSIINAARGVADRIKAGDPMAAMELLISFAGLGLAATGITSVAGIKIMGSGIEVGEIGSYIKDLLNPSLITGAVVGTLITAAVTLPLRQYYNSLFRTTLPESGDLRTYFLRGYVDEATVRQVLAKQGFADNWIDAEVKSWQVIPGIQDLINFVVREVITPEDFYKWSKKQGLDEYWAKNYWEAHWVLPSFGNLREAFWRGIITEEEFKKFIIWHDYKPEPRPGISKSDQEIIAQLSYELPGRIDARWMFETGAIDADKLKELLKATGLHPDWLDATVEATVREVLRSEIESVVREAMTDYKNGWLTRDDFINLMQTLGLAPRLQEYWIARADMLAAREARDEQYNILLNSFRLGIIDEQTFREELKALGMLDDKIERVIYLEQVRKAGKSKAA